LRMSQRPNEICFAICDITVVQNGLRELLIAATEHGR
jgi:hypothetical protein